VEYNSPTGISSAEEISKRLNFIRLQNNLNQEGLAKALHISQPAISKYLKGRTPPPDVLLNFAQLGQTSIEWILTGQKKYSYEKNEMIVREDAAVYGADIDIILAEKIAKLSAEAKITISNLIDLLAK